MEEGRNVRGATTTWLWWLIHGAVVVRNIKRNRKKEEKVKAESGEEEGRQGEG